MHEIWNCLFDYFAEFVINAILFVECVDGFYGYNCKSSCGHCSVERPCDKITGYCPSGCESKFQPPFCQGTHCNEWIIIS